MTKGVSQWWNNWGCCCDAPGATTCPCACYTFNNTLKDLTGRQSPFEKSHDDTLINYAEGRLDKALEIPWDGDGSPAGNLRTIKTPHSSCFSLAGGWSMWCWIYHGATVCPGLVPTYTQQLIRKGDGAALSGGDQPEWVLATRAASPQCNVSSLTSIGFAVGNSGGIEAIQTTPAVYDDVIAAGETADYLTPPDGIFPPHWTFYFMYFDPDAGTHGTMYIGVDGTKNWVTKALTFAHQVNNGPVHIGAQGNRTNRTRIDNLGFCKQIGTVDEMKARAVYLYNSGLGRACPAWTDA